MTDVSFLFLYLITFSVFLTRTASMWLMIPLYGADVFGFSVDAIGLALATISVSNFLMLPIVGPLIDRFGASGIAISSTLLTGFALLLLGLVHDIYVFWIGMVLLGIGGAFAGPAVSAALVDLVPRGLFGPALGLQRAVGDAGFVLGPILVGLLYDLTPVEHTGGLVANAGLMFVSGGVLAFGA